MAFRRGALNFAIAALFALCPIDAGYAQLAGSALFTTDYELRGLSLSNGLPAISGGLTYDHPQGPYAGLTATGVQTSSAGVQFLGYIANAGYARRMGTRASFDTGITYSHITTYDDQLYIANYTEIYAGFSAKNVSAHVYYSPNYLSIGASSFYFECNLTTRPVEHLRLFGHAGLLALFDRHDADHLPTQQFDFRVGAAVEFDRFEVQLAWAGPASRTDYLTGEQQSVSPIVFSVAAFF